MFLGLWLLRIAAIRLRRLPILRFALNTAGLPRHVLPAFGRCEHTRGFARLCSPCLRQVRAYAALSGCARRSMQCNAPRPPSRNKDIIEIESMNVKYLFLIIRYKHYAYQTERFAVSDLFRAQSAVLRAQNISPERFYFLYLAALRFSCQMCSC